MENPKRFFMMRHKDPNGISGTGRVLDGVLFKNGKVVVCWLTHTCSVNIYDSFEAFEAVHVDHHGEGANKVIWVDHDNDKISPGISDNITVDQ